MKGMKRLAARALCALAACVFMFALLAEAAAPAWRWRVEVIPATGTNEIQLLLSAGGQVEWVRWNRIAGPTNKCTSEVTLISREDGWETALGTLLISNAVETVAVSAGTGSASATNGQWRVSDTLRVRSSGVTNGTVAVGHWYYE